TVGNADQGLVFRIRKVERYGATPVGWQTWLVVVPADKMEGCRRRIRGTCQQQPEHGVGCFVTDLVCLLMEAGCSGQLMVAQYVVVPVGEQRVGSGRIDQPYAGPRERLGTLYNRPSVCQLRFVYPR